MLTFALLLFWTAIFIVVYSYGGYVVFIRIYESVFPKKQGVDFPQQNSNLLSVSFIIAAYNESAWICKKIENTLSLQYPSDKVEIIVVTDGSTDNTPQLIEEKFGNRVKLLHQSERMGKSAAMNRAVAHAEGEILIFSDANTMLGVNALQLITQHYLLSNVGGVSGKKMVQTVESAGAANQEGAYWKYESFLKQQDSDFYTVVGAAGELFSVRKELFVEIPSETILDDFFVSLHVCQKGYRVVFEQRAVATEFPSLNIREEAKRKVRIAAGGFQSIVVFKALLNIFKYGKLSYLYISHRVLRWAICPFLLPLLLIVNVYLVANSTQWQFYGGALLAQAIFYLLALFGWLKREQVDGFMLARIPYYFVFMNMQVISGFWLFLRGGQSSTWQRSARAELLSV